MPTNSRVFLKPFIGGLNTEASDVDDMVLNTSDELNCTILPEQMRGRRYGFNIEKDGKWIDSGEENIVAHSLYHWNNVYEDVNYVVVQINDKLYIYPDERPFSQQQYIASIDLSQYATLTTIEPVSMTSVTNSLFVVGRWITPIVIEAIANTSQFTVVINNPKFRDFNGVEDGYAVDYLPTATEGLTNRHKYNLINQGWDKTIYDPNSSPKERSLLPDGFGYEGLFFNEYQSIYGVGCYPANNMQWFLGKQNSGKYNTTDLLNTFFGNTPAPKGHFIIDYLHRDRSLVSGIDVDDEPAELNRNYDATIPVNNSNGWAAYELGSRILDQQPPYQQAYINIPSTYKISYSLPINVSGVLTKFSWGLKDSCIFADTGGMSAMENAHAAVKNAYRNNAAINNIYIFSQPFKMSLIGITSNASEVEIANQTIQLTGKMFSAAGWDFTVLNTTSYVRYEIRITWPSLDRSHGWIVPDTLIETLVLTEINYDENTQESYEGLPSSDLLRGAITDVESFGGRVFYLCGSTVLFSQTLSTNNKNFDKCYQEADPTSEEVSDIVATDGGMIQLLSLGRGKALKSFYRGVLVFGDEEVTGILSNNINLFSAESYDVVKISTAGLTSKYSVVETDNAVFYWSNHGIYSVSIDENNNIMASCISLNTIQNWYNNLSQFSKDNCVGYYDYANNRIYWFYPTTNNADKLDGCLVYDLTFNSFIPQYIDSGSVIRDLHGDFAGILSAFKNYYTRNGKKYDCNVVDDTVYDSYNNIIGYIQNKYLTDCQESSSIYEIEPTCYLRAGGQKVVADENKVLANSTKDAGFNRKTAGVFLISDGVNYSFGDFNDREFRDWDVSPYESYLVSRPITLGDTYFNKQTPIMQTLFKRTEEYKLKERSDAYITTYSLEPYRIKASDGIITSYTDVLNAGKFIKTDVTLDFTGFTDVVSKIEIKILGRKNESTLIGTQVLNNISSTTKYTTTVECSPEYAEQEFDKFSIQIRITPNSSEDLHIIDETNTFVMYRTKADEKKFKGYKEVSVTGRTSMENIQDHDYKVSFKTVEGKLKNASITFEPMINSIAVYPHYTTWDADLLALLEGPMESPTGIETSVEGYSGDYTLSGSPDSGVLNFDRFSIVMNNIQVHGGGLVFVIVSYNLTLLVPEYEEFAIIESADYTTPSGAFIRMRWGWSVNPLSNRWDMVQNGYRPQKDFLHDDYVESRLHIRGRGKAFQVEIRNDENKDFRLTGLNIITRSPQ